MINLKKLIYDSKGEYKENWLGILVMTLYAIFCIFAVPILLICGIYALLN